MSNTDCVDEYGFITPSSGAIIFGLNILHGIIIEVVSPIVATTLGLHIENNTGNANVVMGLYTDSSSKPNTLLARTAEVVNPSPGSVEIPLISSVMITPGTYWIVGVWSKSLLINKEDGPTNHFVAYTYNGQLPSSHPDGMLGTMLPNFFLKGECECPSLELEEVKDIIKYWPQVLGGLC